MKKPIFVLSSVIALSFAGCATTTMKSQNFTTYINQFIGKPKTEVIQNLDLKQFDFTDVTVAEPANQLIYKINRTLDIPLSTPNISMPIPGSNDRTIIPSTAPLGNSYQTDIQCYIIFNLENDIVKTWKTQGKGC